ncbi:MAG: DUF3341 domain-containing protein [Candidatus Methylomirabilales bacterium]
MSRRVLLATFERAEDIRAAASAARRGGLGILDAYTPYAVHGLDAAMGLGRSRLPVVCFAAAAVGAVLKLWFEFWTTMVDWPVNVGGKPWNSLPAFVPVTFEVMVLSAGLTTVGAFLVLSRLWPGKRAVMPSRRVTDDRFVLAVEETDATFDVARVSRLFSRHHAVSIEERVEEEVRP